jgi:hypothetical protein
MRRLFLIVCLLLVVTALGSSASLAQTKLDASIFSYDGKDFTRTETTLMNEGQSAVGTKLAPAWSTPTPGRRPFLVRNAVFLAWRRPAHHLQCRPEQSQLMSPVADFTTLDTDNDGIINANEFMAGYCGLALA